MSKKTATSEETPLEKLVERLEQIVEQLESGKAGLEDSINLYKEGKRLGDDAIKRLQGLERRIQLVREGKDGQPVLEDFPEQQSS